MAAGAAKHGKRRCSSFREEYKASRSHRTPSSGIYEEKEVLPMSDYELLMIVFTVVGIIIAVSKR